MIGLESAPTNTADEQPNGVPQGALQAILVGRSGLTIHRLPAVGLVVVGRGPDADLRVEDERVSRSHARLRCGPELTIEDLDSANGTRLRGQRLPKHEWTPLSLGEGIEVGSHTIYIQRVKQPAPAKQPAPSPPTTPPIQSLHELASEPMRALYRTVERVARGSINVLILGETGAGKDVLARYLHHRSPGAAGPFVRVECATLSEDLLVSDLFGHERGAFTGAVQTKPGLLETAQGGTVFLDEVGELPLVIQAKLLHAVETRRVQRAGSVKAHQIDVRFVAATNRNLDADVAQGRFRRDLYFRLSGFTAVVPPLRQRVSEIVPLARQFVSEAAAQLGIAPPVLADDAMALLEGHSWPGNVRELRNVIELAVLLGEDQVITAAQLPLQALPQPRAEGQPLATAGQDDERTRILQVLAACGGNQTQAALQLGIARGTLASRLAAYGVPRPRPRTER